jgi:hypothetical protein
VRLFLKHVITKHSPQKDKRSAVLRFYRVDRFAEDLADVVESEFVDVMEDKDFAVNG